MLTKRQKDVVELIRDNLTNKVIGEILGLKEKTVENYTNTLYKKFNIKGRYEIWKSLV